MSKKNADEIHKKSMMNLMFSLYDGKAFNVGDFLRKYIKSLKSKGIEPPAMNKLYNLFYAVKNQLAAQDLIRKLKHGVFYLSSQGTFDYPENDDDENSENPDSYNDEIEGVLPTTVITGEGEGEVYVFCYKIYQEMAKIMGHDRFRLKIGRTNVGCERRFTSGTDCPEHRNILLIIKTEKPLELEKLLHSALILRGHQADCPGNEWFDSSVEEIMEIYNTVAAA